MANMGPADMVEARGEGRGLQVVLFVSLWFVWNITIGIVTKWILLYGEVCLEGQGCRQYSFPLATTAIHMGVSQTTCYVYIYHIRRSLAGRQLDGLMRLRKVGPLAAFFAATVACGNLSLKYVYPSFKQMVGSGSPVVTVAMSVLVTRTRYNWWSWASMPMICGGLWMCTAGEVNFHAFGFVFAIGSMVLRSAKSIAQAQLLGKEERIDPVTLLFYMSPLAGILVLLVSLVAEGTEPYMLLVRAAWEYKTAGGASGTNGAGGGHGLPMLLLLLLASGLNACFLNITGFLVTRCTSAVTLQVLGSLKSCLGIALSVAVFGNELRPNQACGIVVCLVGVWIYESRGRSIKVAAKAKEG